MDLKHYKKQFVIYGEEGLKLGNGTKVNILSLSSEQVGKTSGQIRVYATVELEATVEVVREFKHNDCSTCGATASMPDRDGLWYILENHDGSRLLFPQAEEEAYRHPERDSYPAPGWRVFEGALTCPDCLNDLMEAFIEVRKKRAPK